VIFNRRCHDRPLFPAIRILGQIAALIMSEKARDRCPFIEMSRPIRRRLEILANDLRRSLLPLCLQESIESAAWANDRAAAHCG